MTHQELQAWLHSPEAERAAKALADAGCTNINVSAVRAAAIGYRSGLLAAADISHEQCGACECERAIRRAASDSHPAQGGGR